MECFLETENIYSCCCCSVYHSRDTGEDGIALGGVGSGGWLYDGVLNEADADETGGAKLFWCCCELVSLKVVVLGVGSFVERKREV